MTDAPQTPADARDRGDAPRGVIHDIGYRTYDGPRLGRGYIRGALALEGLRGAFGIGRSGRAKIVPMLLLGLMCLPALVTTIIAAVTGISTMEYGGYSFSMQPLIAVFAATQAPMLVSRDLRSRVLPLYFSRPMSSTDYVLAKYAAMAGALLVLLAVPLTVLLAGSLLAELPVREQLTGYAQALAGAVMYALVIAGMALLVASLATRRGLGVAAIVTVLLVLSGMQAAVQGIAEADGAQTLGDYSALISPFTLVAGITDRLLDSSILGVSPPGTLGIMVYVVAAASVVAATFALLDWRYRRVPMS